MAPAGSAGVEPITPPPDSPSPGTPPPPAGLLFQPEPEQSRLRESLERVPRYLFRLYAPKSAGRTDFDCAVSAAASAQAGSALGRRCETDLLQLPRNRAAAMLCSHILWESRADDNLVSWTSSLLFAIQHGSRRVASDRPRPNPSDVRICVVDTRDFPTGTFAKDTDLLDAFSGPPHVQLVANLRRKFYFGEYLSQGRLEIRDRSRHTSLERLTALGLYDIEPRLEYAHQGLAKRIQELRGPFRQVAVGYPLSKRDVRKAITIAQVCFGDSFALVVAAMLLSFRPRKQQDPVIIDAFRATFTEDEITALALEELKIDGDRLPEIQQFEQLILDIRLKLAPKKLSRPDGKTAAPISPLYPDLSASLPQEDECAVADVINLFSKLTVSKRGAGGSG